MEITNRFMQAYRQAPWRTQLQWGGLFLLSLVMAALIAGVYLNISNDAARAGLEANELDITKETTQRHIADMQTRLALLTSQEVMEKRAADLGFVDADPESVTYIVVKNFPGRETVVLAPPPGPDMVTQPIIKPVYTQSLWEFLFKTILSFSATTGGTVQ
jgi:hypothetical protein